MLGKSVKTSVTGLIAGFAGLVVALAPIFGWEWATGETVAAIESAIIAIAIGLMGFWARDDNVTSEGNKIPDR